MKRFKLCGPKLSWCGLVLSIWGVIQLTLLGFFFKFRAVALIEDVKIENEKEAFESPETYIQQLEIGYDNNAYNCFIAACLYVLTLSVSLHQVWVNRQPRGSDYENFLDN
ncbi:ribonuclease kappa-B [Lepeophtheirus salmonis]|uniref:Ribonuclease kappa-B n=1 Tax=Lepeophtheirus salmonis TaxID=72036 RepID=D3PHH8_LEPSM|nr:ribonuclease kappa-B-like [Lepeophtheirus salmonis]ADD38014.1 Ribonuclease kappa-B [Lepeophtheirus salmonis]